MKKKTEPNGRSGIPYRVCCALLFIFVVSMLMRHTISVGVNWNEHIRTDIIRADGVNESYDNDEFTLVDRGDKVILTVALPQERFFPDATLCFCSEQSVISVYFEEQLLYSSGSEAEYSGEMIGTVFSRVHIPMEAWGKSIRIELFVTENNAFSSVGEFFMFSADEAYLYTYALDPCGFFVEITSLSMCVILVFVLLLSGSRRAGELRRGIYLATSMLCVALWISSQNGQLALLFENYNISWIEYINLYFMPVPLLAYIYESETSRRLRHRIHSLMIANLLLLVVTSILNFTNVLHYCVALPVAHLIFLCDIIVFGYLGLRNMSREKESRAYITAGFTILLVCAGIDILSADIIKYAVGFSRPPVTKFFSLGALYLFVSMLLAYFTDMSEEHTRSYVLERNLQNTSRTIASIPAGICVFVDDLNMKLVSANEFFYILFGYTEKSAKEAGFDSFLFPMELSERERVRAISVVGTPGVQYPEIEFVAVKSDGSRINVLARLSFGETRSLVTANVIDITDRQSVREQLRINQESYKLALRQSGKSFMSLDVQNRTLYIPQDIADIICLPAELPDFPESVIASGIIGERSLEDFSAFTDSIFKGEPSASVRLRCVAPRTPSVEKWVLVSFSSVRSDAGVPLIAIITYEDISGSHQREIDAAFKQISLVALSAKSYIIAEYNLTDGTVLHTEGELFNRPPRLLADYDEIIRSVLPQAVEESFIKPMQEFLRRERLCELFNSGVSEDTFDYRTREIDGHSHNRRMSVQLILDPYSDDVLGQFFFRNVDEHAISELSKSNVEALRRELEANRIRVMINQIQPHFMCNSLSAIRAITKRDPDYAYDLLYDFTTYLRSSIKALSSDTLVDFAEELKNVRAYLNIEKMRFMDALSVEYDITVSDFRVAPLSIQPFAENAVRHGIYPKGELGGRVLIRSYESLDNYIVEITDDGVGFDANATLGRSGEHIGLKNTIYRIETLMGAKVKIESEMGKGTSVMVCIPKFYEE